MATPSIAANAYASLAKLTDPSGLTKGGAARRPAGQSFGALLKDAVGAVSKTAHNSDTQTQAMAAGKANMVDVVTAVAETEVAIDALVVGARQGDLGLRRNHADADLIGARGEARRNDHDRTGSARRGARLRSSRWCWWRAR